MQHTPPDESKPLLERLKSPLRLARDARMWLPSHTGAVVRDALHRERNAALGYTDEEHLAAAVAWLERAQDVSTDGGVAGRYHFERGWTSSYPETTGYIVPTFLRLVDTHGDRFVGRAQRAIDFLLDVQLESGAFPGREVAENRTEPSIFNTAQIVTGLRAWHEHSGEEHVLNSLVRACDWLVAEQGDDGAWTSHTHRSFVSTYTAHASCWLAEAGAYLGEDRYLDAARKHLEWVLPFQDPETGWIRRAGFTEKDDELRQSLTHTLAYAIWGVLVSSDILGHEQGAAVARRAARRVARRLELSGELPGVIEGRFRGAADYTCLTGNCQFASIWFRLHEIEPELPLVSAGFKALDGVMRAQIMRSSSRDLHGSVPGSDPTWGDYLRLASPNWAAKFYIDAMLEKRAVLAALEVPERAAFAAGESSSREADPESSGDKPLRIVMTSMNFSTKPAKFMKAWEDWGFRPDAVLVLREPEPSLGSRLQSKLRDEGVAGFTSAVTKRVLPSNAGTAPSSGPTSEPAQKYESVYGLCRRLDIPLHEVDSFESEAGLGVLRSLDPDLIVFGGGDILREPLLEIPRIGTLNAHMGILPPFRGVNVAEWARMLGQPVGCTVYFIDPGIDTGSIIATREVDTAGLGSVRALRAAVDRAQIDLLGEVVREIVNTGERPSTNAQSSEEGRQYFAMHPELKARLDSALAAEAR